MDGKAKRAQTSDLGRLRNTGQRDNQDARPANFRSQFLAIVENKGVLRIIAEVHMS
jgi:hypothetical protein